jgi:hypothetical protein
MFSTRCGKLVRQIPIFVEKMALCNIYKFGRIINKNERQRNLNTDKQ